MGLENTVQNRIRGLQYNTVFIALYLALFCVARTKLFSESVSSLVLIVALIIALFANTENSICCMLLSVFIADNMAVFSIVSFQAVVDLIVTLKILYKKKFLIKKNFSACFAILTILQLISIVTFGNQIMNVISFIVRILLLYCIYSSDDLIVDEEVPKLGCISILCGCVIGNLFYQVEAWQRFRAVWNDENFCGMYCLLGIVFAISLILKKTNRKLVLPIASLAVFLFTATRTWSRSFIFITCIVFCVALYFLLKSRNIKIAWKIIIVVIAICGFQFIADYSFQTIIDNRGLTSTNSADWTSGRMTLALDTIDLFGEDLTAMLLGCGASNIPMFRELHGLKAMATHVTYVDIPIQFGLIVGFSILVFMIGTFVRGMRHTKTTLFWAYTVILVYMVCLTLTQYTFIYLILGLYLRSIRKRQ